MAAETTTTALIDEALKIIFAKSLHDDIVAEHELMDLFKAEMNVKTDETTGGRWVEQGHFWQLPAGAGWRADDEYIPEAVSARFKNSRLYLRKMFVTLQMSGDTMRRVRSDEGAFLNYMEQAKPAVVEFANNQLDLAYLGTGSGIKAEVATTPSLNSDGTYTFGVKHHSGVVGYTEAWLCFLEGENIVFSANALFRTLRNAGSGQYCTVHGINEDSNEITVRNMSAALAAAVTVGDCIAEGDGAGFSAVDSTGTPRMLAGLLAGDDDGGVVEVYNNIDRTATDARLWKANVLNAATDSTTPGQLNEDLLDLAFRRTLVRGNGKPDVVVMSHSGVTVYWRSLKGDRRFIDPAGNYTGGKGKLKVIVGDTAHELRVARKLPPEVCFGLQKDRWARLTLGQLTWEEETGSMWNRVVDSTGRKDEYYSVAHLYEQLYCPAPRKNFRIDGITPAERPTHMS